MNTLRQKKAVFLGIILAMTFIRTALAQDFNFTLQPSTLTLVPGQQASIVVSVAAFGGFTNQVTFSTTNLPSGVTAYFSPATFTPPGTSILTLTATADATTGQFTLDIIGTGGGITHMTTSSVSVSFGLLPLCYGAFQGLVTDSVTGKPVAGASVVVSSLYYYYATTDSNGVYVVTNLALAGSENLAQYYRIDVSSNGYNDSIVYDYAVCDATNIVNLQMSPIETGGISGIVTSEQGDLLPNATVQATYLQNTFYTESDSNGFYQFKSLPLGNDNGAAYYTLKAFPDGYWYSYTNAIVQGNSNTVQNIIAVPVCYETVYGKVVYPDTGLPATNISVSVIDFDPAGGQTQTDYSATDDSGSFSFTNVTMGYQNTQRTIYVTASAYGYSATQTNAYVSSCPIEGAQPGQNGGPIDLGTIVLTPMNYGGMAGVVYDVTTGQPVPYATVFLNNLYYYYADSNGYYSTTNILIGSGASTNINYYFTATASGYFNTYSNVVIDANQTTRQDFYILKIGHGAIEGTVYDAVTGLPVSGTYINLNNVYTDADGHYSTGPLALNSPNLPTYQYFYASKSGYWQTYTNTTITNGITNVVDIQLIPVCSGATVVGNVVNALTQDPITNATVSTSSGGYYFYSLTDSNGDFIITNLTVGNNNSPIQSTLTATAPGFNPQNKTVTIFCDAVINTTFGVPETNFGSINGYVTNVLTGQAISNVFIGSSFGGATTTDTNGYYVLNQVPLSGNGSNRTWTVTAIPNNFPAQTKPVVVSANTTNELDFGFGQPLTELIIEATGTPNPVTVGNSLTYSITLTNLKADATNVVLTDTLPLGVTFVNASVTNNPGGFGIPVESNGIVTLTGSDLSSNAGVVLLITVTPMTAGGLTNVTTVTSDTPDISPGSSNHTAIVLGSANAPSNFADLRVMIGANPNPVLVNNQLTYTITVVNDGPATAPSVSVVDTLPANITFSSVTVSQGNANQSTGSIQWSVGTLTSSGTATATVVVLPLVAGQIESTATVSIGSSENPITDPNPDNNSDSVFTLVTTPTITTGTIQYSDIEFNAQTGLFQQQVTYFNQPPPPPQGEQKLGEGPPPPVANAVRLFVLGLPSSIQLYNATGTSNGVPYVEYDNTVPSGGSVQFGLEYYEGSRQPFVSTNFQAVAVVAVTVPPTTGTYLQLDRPSFDYDGELTIEFATVPGHTYEIQYSGDMQSWAAAVPQIVARNTRTEWTDVGPPVTATYGSLGDRFYRIVEIK